MKHTDLVGLPLAELKQFSHLATHQHAKGGLYRDLGLIQSAETKAVLTDTQGRELRAWLHVFPYEQQVFARAVDEDYKFLSLNG